MKKPIFIVFVLFIYSLYSQESKKYQTHSIEAYLVINPVFGRISGKEIIELIPYENTDLIKIDAKGIFLNKVKNGLFNQKYSFDRRYLYIHKKFKKGKKYRFKIKYVAYSQKAMYFPGWKAKKGIKQVWTQGQGKGNSHWLPQNEDQNDKFSWKLNIRFNEDYQVVSNGELIKKTKKKNEILWTYEQKRPAPGYLMFLGIGKYKTDTLQTSGGIKIYNYQYSDFTKPDKTYYKSKEIFDFIQNEIGVSYPWKNYKQIPLRDFLYGGMENVSVSSFNGNRYVVDSITFNDINFINVSAHELAHQWFGDLITGKTSSDHWLHEGFATYYARLNDAHIFGKDYLDYEILMYDDQIKKAAKTDTIPIHRPNASSLSYYQKGARVVQMLRTKIGDIPFKKSIKAFLNKNQFKNVEIKDLQHEIYLQTGDSLKNFFYYWLDTSKIPELKLEHRNDSILFKKNELLQPVPFLFIYPDTLVKKYYSQSFKIPEARKLLTLVPNTDNELLMQLDFDSNQDWIKNQILISPNFPDKYFALKKWKPISGKDSLYQTLIKRNEYYPIYKQILRYALENKKDTLIEQLFDKDLKTRQSIALSMNRIPSKFKEKYKSLLHDASYITKEAVLWRYAMNFPAEAYDLLKQTQKIQGSNDKGFRLTWLTLALISPDFSPKEKAKFFNEIVDYTSPAYIMEVRLNAFAALDAMNRFNKESLSNLLDASLHFNWHLHRPARILLKKLYHNNKYKELIQELIDEKFPPKTKKEFFTKLLNQK